MNTRLLRGCVRTLVRFRARTLLMGLGVALGIAALIAGRSFGEGAERQLMDRVYRMLGPGSLLVWSPAGLDMDDVGTLASLPQVVAWDPFFMTGTFDVSVRDRSRQAMVVGHSEQGAFVWNRDAASGRYVRAADVDELRRVALLGPKLAEALFGDDDPVGEEILVGTEPFEVIGVLASIGIDPHGEDRDEDLLVPISTALRRLTNTDRFGMAKFVVENHELIDDDAEEFTAALRRERNLQPGEKSDFGIATSQFAGRTVAKAQRTLTLYLTLASAIVLLVSTIIIGTVMLAVVRERVAEIGLRKAVGATEGQILGQFLVETTLVAVVAGALGVGLGAGLSRGLGGHVQITPDLTPTTVALAFGAALTVGLLAGVLPARRAARLTPTEALR